MSYKILILRRAQKELAELPSKSYERVKNAIQSLSGDPRPSGCKKLVGREGRVIRVGNYRVIYEIDDEQSGVEVLHVGHRRDVYR